LAVMGLSYAHLSVKHTKEGLLLVHGLGKDAAKGNAEQETVISKIADQDVYLRVQVSTGGKCQFAYSLDGTTFLNAGAVFEAAPGRWKGAKLGIFCVRDQITNDAGWADFDWFRVDAPILR
jgi:hypothetical protein